MLRGVREQGQRVAACRQGMRRETAVSAQTPYFCFGRQVFGRRDFGSRGERAANGLSCSEVVTLLRGSVCNSAVQEVARSEKPSAMQPAAPVELGWSAVRFALEVKRGERSAQLRAAADPRPVVVKLRRAILAVVAPDPWHAPGKPGLPPAGRAPGLLRWPRAAERRR